MFLRKLTVIVLPLLMVLAVCLLMPLLFADWYFGGLATGILLGVSLALLLPLAGATRLREPFAWLLFIPSIILLLILLYQFLARGESGIGKAIPILHLLDISALPSTGTSGLIVAVESAFAAYMMAFSIRTGRGI
jgi:hypothetical protein